MKKALSLLFCFFSVFCKPQKNELVVWHAYRGAEKETLEKIAADYSATHQDLPVRLLQIPYDAFADKLNHAIPRGKGPDIFIFAHDRIGDWAEKKLVEPLDFLVNASVQARFLTKPLQSMYYAPDLVRKVNGAQRLYGLPMNFKTLALYRNTKLVKKAPSDFQELISLAKQNTQASAGKFGLIYANDKFFFHSLFHFGFGGELFDQTGLPAVYSPGAVQAAEFARSLYKQHAIIPEEISGTLTQSLFNEGKAAFVINGPWFMAEIGKEIFWEASVLPAFDKKKKSYPRPFLTVEGVMMNALSSKKLQAYEFMKFVTSDANMLRMLKEGGQIPANKNIHQSGATKMSDHIRVFADAQENAVIMPNTPAVRSVWTPLDTMLSRIIFYEANAELELRRANAQIVSAARGDNQ